ncbi:MAG: hypothetical protein AAGE03_11815 [Pseudomonadota bacterium]
MNDRLRIPSPPLARRPVWTTINPRQGRSRSSPDIRTWPHGEIGPMQAQPRRQILRTIAKRGALFAAITFGLLMAIDSLIAGEITRAIIARSAAIALGGSLVYSAIRFVIAWANK